MAAAGTFMPGQVVPFKFNPGIVVASYFVSLIGAVTTVELLHRRRSRSGWISWVQLFAIAVAFGLVGIWCMHFVGNRAIVLGDARMEYQLDYNPGFTTLSAFFPIVFLFLGLTTVELRQPGERFFWPALVFAGVIAGLSCMGMHYVGNFGINNYKMHNPPGYIAGAALIAVFACILALTLFYYFRERWINSFPRRLFCACILACAVSGMHWMASVGTKYTLINAHRIGSLDRETNLIVAVVMCLVACVGCILITVFQALRKKRMADRAQQVLLASATFDPEGRLLVTQDGMFPCQKVTKSYDQRSLDDEFNTGHPVFQWLFRITHNWSGVTDLIPAMRNHLRHERVHESLGNKGDANADAEELDGVRDYSLIFREQFCVAASDLALSMDSSLDEIGSLYYKILITGNTSPGLRLQKQDRDVEADVSNPVMFGRGQLLFLVRTIDSAQANRFLSQGYRFAMPNQIGDIVSRSLQISTSDFTSTANSLREYAISQNTELDRGTYLAGFTLRAPLKGTWEVLVSSRGSNIGQLPRVRLTKGTLEPWQAAFLSELEGTSLDNCTVYLSKVSNASNVGHAEFAQIVLDAISELAQMVPEPFFRQAAFSSKPVNMTGGRRAVESGPTLFPFCIIPDVHDSVIKSTERLTYVPLGFFRASQRVYRNAPDHAQLAQHVHREFAGILAAKDSYTVTEPSNSGGSRDSGRRFRAHRIRKRWQFSESTTPRNSIGANLESSSEHDLVSEGNTSASMDMSAYPFGGIMVSSDVVVETASADSKGDGQIELRDLGITSQAGVAETDHSTYVDELFRLASSQWKRS